MIHGQTTESALCNSVFGSDMETMVVYLFNNELPSPEQTKQVAQIQRQIDDFVTFPLVKSRNDDEFQYQLEIISRF